MSAQFWTGLFTLLASFGSIWIKDFLEIKNSSKTTLKQKALEAYAITDDLPNVLNQNIIACQNLLKNPRFNTVEMLTKNPDSTCDRLKKLELLIIENFSDMLLIFTRLKKIIIDYNLFLYSIICNNNPAEITTTENEFIEAKKAYEKNVIFESILLNKEIKKLLDKKEAHPNFFACYRKIKDFLINFFRRN